MKRYAIIDLNGLVDNIILWDEASQWSPPEGMTMVKVEDTLCDIGWKYENEVFTNSTPPLEPVIETVTEPVTDTPAE
jgi:hypothetical protein